VADETLAREAGVTYRTVTRERRRRGIPPFRPHREAVEWTEAMLARLGKASDREVAAELGLGHRSVFRKRCVLGIPPYASPLRDDQDDWTREQIALLGTASDRDIATHLGRHPSTVELKRKVLRIAPYQPPHDRVEWTAEMVMLLGAVPDTQIAERFAIDAGSVSRKREQLRVPPCSPTERYIARSPALVALLRLPNRQVMRRAEICKATVLKLRHELGIRAPYRRRWTPELVARLGREPDPRIAADLGVTPGAIWDKRRQLGIPAYLAFDSRRQRRDATLLS